MIISDSPEASVRPRQVPVIIQGPPQLTSSYITGRSYYTYPTVMTDSYTPYPSSLLYGYNPAGSSKPVIDSSSAGSLHGTTSRPIVSGR